MGIAAMSVMKPDLIMKSIIPVVMAGIIAIYGFAVSVLVVNERKTILSDSIINFVIYSAGEIIFGSCLPFTLKH